MSSSSQLSWQPLPLATRHLPLVLSSFRSPEGMAFESVAAGVVKPLRRNPGRTPRRNPGLFPAFSPLVAPALAPSEEPPLLHESGPASGVLAPAACRPAASRGGAPRPPSIP